VAALAAALVFAGLALLLVQTPGLGTASLPSMGTDTEALVEDLGSALVDVNRYVVPFEIASVLLLAALIGAIVVARPPQAGGGEESQS
jgi:NADH:ubiquinone oxidoreductase subunit 6 (subunit J)